MRTHEIWIALVQGNVVSPIIPAAANDSGLRNSQNEDESLIADLIAQNTAMAAELETLKKKIAVSKIYITAFLQEEIDNNVSFCTGYYISCSEKMLTILRMLLIVKTNRKFLIKYQLCRKCCSKMKRVLPLRAKQHQCNISNIINNS